MARRSGNDLVDVFLLFFTIIALPIMLIVWIIKAVTSISSNNSSKSTKISSITASNYYDDNNSRTTTNYKKTKKELTDEANVKYSQISENKKLEYLKRRKKNILILYIGLGLFSILFFIIGLITELDKTTASSGGKFLLIIFGLLVIYSLIALFVNIKKSNEKLILEQIFREIKRIYNTLNDNIIKKHTPFVKQHSEMYKNIQKLNNTYSFDRKICKVHKYHEYLNSKRAFDVFNFDKWIIETLDSNATHFNSFKTIYESNYNSYNTYKKEYLALKKFKTIAELENCEVPYEIFNIIEKKIFNNSIQESITAPCIHLDISYTSPTGRNHYETDCTYTYNQIIGIIQDKEKREQLKREETERIKKVIEQKKEKERRLKELDKLEMKLAQKEEEIKRKEKEFIEATKEHIYTADKIETKKEEIEIDENLSLTQKLKLLKEKFDNGEITYEEYQTKRKELM